MFIQTTLKMFSMSVPAHCLVTVEGARAQEEKQEKWSGAKQGARGPRHHCVLTVTQPQSIHMVCVHTSSSHGQNTLSTIAQQRLYKHLEKSWCQTDSLLTIDY